MAEEQQPIDYDKLIGELQMIAKFGDALSGRAFQAIQELIKKVSKLKEKCASLQEMLDESQEEILRLEKEIKEYAIEAQIETKKVESSNESISQKTIDDWINQMMKISMKTKSWYEL